VLTNLGRSDASDDFPRGYIGRQLIDMFTDISPARSASEIEEMIAIYRRCVLHGTIPPPLYPDHPMSLGFYREIPIDDSSMRDPWITEALPVLLVAFSILGLAARRGRDLAPAEHRAGNERSSTSASGT
jgi:hypothetical protein